MTEFEQETLAFAEQRADELKEGFLKEVRRLLESGGVDRDNHHRGILFGVALENLVDGFWGRNRRSRDYRNLRRF